MTIADRDFYTEDEMAELLGIKKTTLKKNRYTGTNHPPYRQSGDRVFYPKNEFNKWFASLPLKEEINSNESKRAV
jgi:hypothetical protein